MKKLIPLLFMQVLILNLWGQNEYLLLSKERRITGYHPTDLVELSAAIIYNLATDNLPELKIVERKIMEGTVIKVKSYERGREKIKGKLDIFNDSTIIVGSDTLYLYGIKKIFVRTDFTKIAGPVITGAGVAGTIYLIHSVPGFIKSSNMTGYAATGVLLDMVALPLLAAVIISSAVAVVGGILYSLNGNAYNIHYPPHSRKHGWQIKVVHYDSIHKI